MFSFLGYGAAIDAPGYSDPLFLLPKVLHNVIRAHVKAYRLYEKSYRSTQNGKNSFSVKK